MLKIVLKKSHEPTKKKDGSNFTIWAVDGSSMTWYDYDWLCALWQSNVPKKLPTNVSIMQEAQKLYVSHESLMIGLCIRILHKYCWLQAILAHDSRLQRWFPRTCSRQVRQVPIKHTTISTSISLLNITFLPISCFPSPKKKKQISTPSTCAQRPRNHPRSAEWSAEPAGCPPCPGFRSYLGAGCYVKWRAGGHGCPDIGYFID